MTSYEYTPGDEFRNIEHALWLLTAFRAEFDTPLKDNEWLQEELKTVVQTDDPDEIGAALGRIVVRGSQYPGGDRLCRYGQHAHPAAAPGSVADYAAHES